VALAGGLEIFKGVDVMRAGGHELDAKALGRPVEKRERQAPRQPFDAGFEFGAAGR